MGVAAVRYGEVYLYRTRKPSGRSWLRHNGYVGKTRSPKQRHRQHMGRPAVGDRYVSTGQPWSDLEPRRHVVFRMRHCPDWLLALAELMAIRLLLPVYNISGNRGNPRRIRPWVAQEQRRARDRGHRFSVWYVRPAYVATSLLALVALAGTWQHFTR